MLEIVVADRRIQIELQGPRGTARIDGREVACDCVRLPDGRYSIILDGRVYELSVELAGDVCHISNGLDHYLARIFDPRRLESYPRVEEARGGFVRIMADMPGKVVRVLVAAGDAVQCDRGLLVLEAMKMQNEIRAPRAGCVSEVAVVEGQTVASGEFLVSLE